MHFFGIFCPVRILIQCGAESLKIFMAWDVKNNHFICAYRSYLVYQCPPYLLAHHSACGSEACALGQADFVPFSIKAVLLCLADIL